MKWSCVERVERRENTDLAFIMLQALCFAYIISLIHDNKLTK